MEGRIETKQGADACINGQRARSRASSAGSARPPPRGHTALRPHRLAISSRFEPPHGHNLGIGVRLVGAELKELLKPPEVALQVLRVLRIDGVDLARRRRRRKERRREEAREASQCRRERLAVDVEVIVYARARAGD